VNQIFGKMHQNNCWVAIFSTITHNFSLFWNIYYPTWDLIKCGSGLVHTSKKKNNAKTQWKDL